MMEFMSEYGLFLLKAVTIVVAILAATGGVLGLALRQKNQSDESLELNNLNDKYEAMQNALTQAVMDPKAQKIALKVQKKKDKLASKKRDKEAKKSAKSGEELTTKKRLYVIDFDGDIKATPVESMREEISALLTLATNKDEVLIRLESGGGAVHSYGLAASQLQRIRDHKIPLTVSVDRVAASGGYLMACVADKIIAAPFSIIGSIGVIAQIPNVHKVLKKLDVDIEQLTAGKYKRTLTLLGENTDEARAKMQEELEEVHDQFKDFVSTRRPSLDIEKVATGEHWLGERAFALGLVDKLETSDDYLLSQRESSDIIHLSYTTKQGFVERIISKMSVMQQVFSKNTQDGKYPQFM